MNDDLQRFIDSLDDQVLVIGPGFKAVCANKALLQALDRVGQNVEGHYCYEISHGRSKRCAPPDGTCPAQEVWEGAPVSRSVHTHSASNGSRQYIEIVATPIKDSDGQIVQVVEVMRDVTAQKQVGAKLVQRNRELAALLSMARAVTLSLELKTVLAEGLRQAATVIDADAGAIYLHNEANDGLVLAAQSGVSAEFAAELGTYLQGEAASGRSGEGAEEFAQVPRELVEHHSDGARGIPSTMICYSLRVAGRQVGELVLLTDDPPELSPAEVASVTALVRGLAVGIENARLFGSALRAKREWEHTFGAIRDGIAITGPDYRIRRVNQAFLQMFDVDESHALGQRCCHFFYGAVGPTPGFHCHQILGTEQSTPVEVDNLTIPGTFHISLFPLHDDDGEFLGLIHSVRDVSEERAVRDVMARNERLVAMGRLAASVAHEINNPLFSIRNCLALLDDVVPDDEPSKSFLHLAKGELDRLAQTVRGLLDFVRPEEEPRETVDLNGVLERAVLMTHKQMEYAHVTVSKDLAPGLPPLLASSGQMAQVAINLILNAIEAMPDGGNLRVITRLGPQWDGLSLVSDRTVETVQMSFIDTGVGIEQEHLDAIFEPFFSTKEEVKGVGLGLAISHGIVQRHHGTIEVESEVGAGSTFLITLPLLTKEEWEAWERPEDASLS